MSPKSIFIIVFLAIISTAYACKLDLPTLCEVVKADIADSALKIDDDKCKCDTNQIACNTIALLSAPYDFATLCPTATKAILGKAQESCNCDNFKETCKKVNECNAASMMNESTSIMPSSSVVMETSTMMVGEVMTTTTMTDSVSMTMSTESMTPTPSSSMMMSSSIVSANNNTSSANQIQIGRAALSFCTLGAVLFYYIM